jgi:sec-independent protein translocase protein TatA
LLVIATVALLVFGPKELPDLARKAGRGLRELQGFRQRLHDELAGLLDEPETSDDAPDSSIASPPTPSPDGRPRD